MPPESAGLSWSELLGLIGATVSVVSVIVGLGVLWGAEKQTRKGLAEELKTLKKDLDTEIRPALHSLAQRLSDVDREEAACKAFTGQKIKALEESASDKASKESVANIKEMLNGLKDAMTKSEKELKEGITEIRDMVQTLVTKKRGS